MNEYSQPPIPSPDGAHNLYPASAPLPSPAPSPKPPVAQLAGRSIREGVLLVVATIPLALLLSKLHWSFLLPSEQNSNSIEKLSQSPVWQVFGLMVVAAPIIEETLCRGIPLLLLKLFKWKPNGAKKGYSEAWSQQGTVFWIFAIISSVIFSMLHGVGGKSLTLPLPQLIAGFFLWRAASLRGLRYSMLLHATYNSIPACLLLLNNAVKQ